MPGICLFWHIHADDFACLILAASYKNDKSMIISGTIQYIDINNDYSQVNPEGGRRKKVWAVERGRIGV